MKKFGKGLAVTVALATLTTGMLAGCGKEEIPTRLTLDKETLSLDADRSEQLVATGANEVVWESSDPAVATVDAQGNVTGVNPGTVTVTATTKDGKYEAECTVTVTGYHLSSNVFSGFTKVENNTYNGEINYAIDNSSEDAFVVSYDRVAMTNSWTSLVLWYDCALSPTSFDLEFEVTQGSLPCLMFEFGGESSFKHYERHAVTQGKNTVSLNITDLDLDGEGSWKAIYLELNNPCPLEGTTDTEKGETKISFTSVKMTEGTKQAPAAPANAEVKDGVVYWDRVLAAAEYELEVDGTAISDLMSRTRASGDAPVMRRAYKPTEENAFTVGNHTARIRSKNSAGVSDWTEFAFTVKGETQRDPFTGISSHGGNPDYNPDFYTASEGEDGSVTLTFTAAEGDEWNTYFFYIDDSAENATKLHIELEVTGNVTKVGYITPDNWAPKEAPVEDGKVDVTFDIPAGTVLKGDNVKLALSYFDAVAGENYTVKVIDVSLYSEEEEATFRGIASHNNNPWSEGAFFTATEAEGAVTVSFTATADSEWNTYWFNLNESTAGATKLHVKLYDESQSLTKVAYQLVGSGSVIDLEFTDGYAEITVDLPSDATLGSGGAFMLFLSKYATTDTAYEVQVLDVSVY